MSEAISTALLTAIQAIDPRATGSLVMVTDHGGGVRVYGTLLTTGDPTEAVRSALRQMKPEQADNALIQIRSSQLQVVTVDGDTRQDPPPEQLEDKPYLRGRQPVVYLGMLPTSAINPTGSFKRLNWQTRDKVGNCVVELGVIAPLILDQALNVIDGNQRLAIAQELGIEQVPVMVLRTTKRAADFLRLVINRSSEFQKWKHDEIDPFVNGNPVLQPLLEPLGFFGEQILPVSFFGDSILNYKIDPENKQQQQYSQEIGLARWAEIQRERVEAQEELKKRARPLSPVAQTLFELPPPTEADFMTTLPLKDEMERFLVDTRAMAALVTKNYDEARGDRAHVQHSRRTYKQMKADGP